LLSILSFSISKQNLSISGLLVKELNSDWFDVSYLDQEYVEIEVSYRAKSVTTSGFSSGAWMNNNMFAWFNQNIDGMASLSGGGPCTTRP
jgi:hypothetical protein